MKISKLVTNIHIYTINLLKQTFFLFTIIFNYLIIRYYVMIYMEYNDKSVHTLD